MIYDFLIDFIGGATTTSTNYYLQAACAVGVILVVLAVVFMWDFIMYIFRGKR